MNLFSELDAFERSPEYIGATPEIRAKSLDIWKAAAARKLIKAPDELPAAETVVEETLAQRKSRERSRLQPGEDGIIPPLAPSWDSVVSTPDYIEMKPEERAKAASVWADTAAAQRNGIRLNKTDRAAWLFERRLAETDAGSDLPVDRSTINTTDFLRPYEQAATAKAEKPVPNTGKVALVSAPDGTQSLDVHPTAALASEDEYYAMIDGIEGASPTAKMDAKAQYDVLRGAAKAKIQSKLAPTTTQLKLEEAKGGTMSALGTALRNAPGTIFGLVGAAMDTADTAGELSGTPEDAASRKIKSMASSVAGFRTTGASYAVTPSLIEDYKEDGASAIPLLSEDPKVRAAAEKQVLDELASNVLPGIDPELAAAAKNPGSSQAKELINTVRDNMLSQLWVDPEDAQEYPFEQLRVLSDGTPVWNPKFVESLSKADIAAVVDKAGLTGEARDTAITAGIQARNASSEDAVSDIRLMGRPYQEGFGQGVTLDFLSEQDSSYRNFVLDRVESEDFKSGRIDAADIIAEWKKQNTGFTRVAKAAINRALGAVPAFGKQLSIIAAGGTAAAADLAGIKTPELDQWIADNVQINSVLQQAAAGAETTWWQKTAGQLGKEVPFLLIGAAAARAGAAGAAATTDAALAAKAAATRGVATAAGRAVEGRMITRAAGLGKQALASVQSLMNGTSLASRTYFGMQAGRSAGDMYTSVYGQLLEQGKAAGMSEQAARENARTGAIIPSIVAAGVTGTLMKLMPGGAERLVGMAAGRAPTLGKLAEVFGKTKLGQALANAEWKSTYAKALTSVFAGIGKEATEESIDEFVQTVIRAGYDDSLRLDDMLTAAGEAGLIGGIMGGASGAFEAGVDIRLANQEKRSLALAEQRRIQQEAAAKKARMSDVLDELDRVGAAETKGAVEATLEEEAAAQIAMEKSAFSAVFLNQIPTEDDGSGEEQPVMYESDTEYATEEAARARVTEIQTFFSDVASRRANHPVTRFELGVEKGAGGWRVTALFDPAAVAEAAATPPDAGAAPPAAPVVDPNASPVVQAFNAAVATAKAPPKKFEDLKSDWERLANEYHTSTPDTRRPELSDELEAATKALNSPRTAKQRGGVKAVNPELLDLQKEVPGTLLPEGVSEVRRKGRKDTRPFIQKANSQYKGLPADTVKRAKLKTKLHAALTAFSAAPDADKADRVAALTKELDNAGVRASISNAVQKELEQAAARANTAPAPESKAPKSDPVAAPAAEPAPVVIDVQAEVVPVEAAPVVEAPVVETPAEAPVVEAPAEAPPAEVQPAEPAAPPEVVVDYKEVAKRSKSKALNLPLPDWVDEGYTPTELGAAIDGMFGKTKTEPRPFGVYNGTPSLASQNSRAVAYNAMTPAMKEAFEKENKERILANLEREASEAATGGRVAAEAGAQIDEELTKNPEALAAIYSKLVPRNRKRLEGLVKTKEAAEKTAKTAASKATKAAEAAKKSGEADPGLDEDAAKAKAAYEKSKEATTTAKENLAKVGEPRKTLTVKFLHSLFSDESNALAARLTDPEGTVAEVMDDLRTRAIAEFETWSVLRTLHDSEVEGMKQLAESLMGGYLQAFRSNGQRMKTEGREASEVFSGEVSGVRVFGKESAAEAVQMLANAALKYAKGQSGRVRQKENTVSFDAQVGDQLNADAAAAEEGRASTGGDQNEFANQPVEDSGDAQAAPGLEGERALQVPDSYAGDSTREAAKGVADWAGREIQTREDASAWLELQKTANPLGYENVRESLDQYASELRSIAEKNETPNRKKAALGKLMDKFSTPSGGFATAADAAKTHAAKILLIRAGVVDAMGKPELVESRAAQKAVKKEDRATLTEQQKLTEKRISAELKNLGAVDGDPESLIIALTKIAESSEYPAHLSASARFLLDTGAINLIESFQIVNDPGMDSAGHYDPNTGAVVINTANPNPRGAADVLVHEIFHPLWVEAITADHAPGSPEAAAADRFRAVYRDAKLTYMQRRSTIEALEKDIAELLVARMMLESPGGMRRALARAKAKGIEYAADYVTDLPLEEVRALYAAHLAESSGVTAALNLIEDFDYVFQAKETNGISREFATHLATDHNFQILIDRVLSPAGTNTATGRPIGWRPMLRALWSSGLSALNARAATVTAPSSMPMLFNDLRLLIGDAATSYTPMRSRPKIPVAVTFRKRAGIQAGITPAGTVIVTAGTGVQAPTLSVTPSAATASTSPAASVFNLAEPRPVTVETTPDGSVVMTAGAGAKAPTLSVAPVDVTSSVGAETTVFSLMQPLVTAAPGIDQSAAAEAVASVEPNAEVRAEIEVDPEIAPDPIMDVLMQEDVTVANLDDLEKALRVSVERKNASTLELKRSLKIGYARGVRLSNILEQLGVFSPVSPANRRNLLVTDINSPEAVAILEGIAAAREAKTNPVKQDATQERNLTEGDLGQYQEGDQTGTPAEAGRGDGAAAGGQVQGQVAPLKSRAESTRRQFLGSLSALAAAFSVPGCNMPTLEQRISEVVRSVGDDVTPAVTVERVRNLAAAGTTVEVNMKAGAAKGLQLFLRQVEAFGTASDANRPIRTNVMGPGSSPITITAQEVITESTRIIETLDKRLPEIMTAVNRIAGIMQDITGVDMSGTEVGLFTMDDDNMAILSAISKDSRLYGAVFGQDGVARFHPGTLAALVSDSPAIRLKAAASIGNEFTHAAQLRKNGSMTEDTPVFSEPNVALPKIVERSYRLRISEDYRGTPFPRAEAESFELAWLAAKAFVGTTDRVVTVPEVAVFAAAASRSFAAPERATADEIIQRMPARISGSEVLFSRANKSAQRFLGTSDGVSDVVTPFDLAVSDPEERARIIAETKARVVAGTTVGTRSPTSVAESGTGADVDKLVDLESARKDQALFRKNALLIASYPAVAREFPQLASMYRKAAALEYTEDENALVNKLTAAKKPDAEKIKAAKKDRETAARKRADKRVALLVKENMITTQMAERVYQVLNEVATSNLQLLINLFPAKLRPVAQLWYDGANIIANKFASDYGTDLERSAAVLAVFSPQKDWFMNVSLGERFLKFWIQRDSAVWTKEMTRKFLAVAGEPRPIEKDGETVVDDDGNPVYKKGITAVYNEDGDVIEFKGWDSTEAAAQIETAKKLAERLEGKKFSEISEQFDVSEFMLSKAGKLDEKQEERRQKAVKLAEAQFARMWSQTNHPSEFQVVAPNGEFGDLKRSEKSGNPARVAWGGYNTIEKAIAIMRTPDSEKMAGISEQLGDKHKVRSFYNNIADPANTRGHVTMDTHAIAAILMLPLSGNSLEVMHNFGGKGTAGSSILGLAGTYAGMGEAYRSVAAALELLPREVQSITWEAVRLLFPAKFKSKKQNVDAVRTVWDQYEAGALPIEQVHDTIYRIADEWSANNTGGVPSGKSTAEAIRDGGGLPNPDWGAAAVGGGDAAVRQQGADVAGKLPADGRTAAERGGRGRAGAGSAGVVLGPPGRVVGRRKADGAAARAYAEGQNVRIAVSPGLADRMNSRSMSDTDRRILRSAIDEAQVLAAEIFYEGAPEEGYIDNGVMMSRSTKNQSFRTAPDWFKRYMSTAGVLGMDPEEADAWAEFAYPLFLEAPAEWTSSASPDEIAMMTWLLNRKVRVATAAGGKKAKDELPDLMDQIRTLGGLSQINPGGEDHQQLYSMQTTFDTAFHKPLQALKKIGVSRSSRVAGTDGIFTPGAVRVDGAYTAITSTMDAAYRLLPPATADRSLWFAAVMADERFETMVAATKTPGLPEALRNFRTEVRAKYPVISTDDTGKLTGMTAMMQDIDSVIRDLAGIGATLDPDAISKRLDSIVSRLGADPKMKAKAMNIMFGQTPVTSSELRGIALMTLQVDITSVLREKAMSAKKEKGALRFLGAGAEAFAFSDDAQGIIYKIILPRFSGTSVGFSFDLPAPNRTGSAAGAFIPSATAATIGRSPLRQMLVEEHTAVPGLVDSEVVAMTAFGAVVTAQKVLGGEEFGMEQHGGQALLWSQTHNASFFDATKLTTRFGGNVVRDAVLIRDALGEFRVLLDFRDTNVFAAGPILAPFDVMVSAPVPPTAMESQILSRAAEDIMRSRKASKLTDRVRGFLIAGKPGSFAEEISKGDPNEVLDLARFAGLSRYGKFGKAFAQTKQDFDYRIRAVRKTAINMLEELGTVVKGATDDQYKWVNLMLGSQDNMYDEAMHRLATTAYRRARLGATRRYRSARRRAAAFAGLPEEAQMIAEANTAFETDMRDATNTFRSELDAALDAGILAFKVKQDDARRLLQASPGGDRMYRTAAALRQELDRLGSEMLKHTDLDPRVRAIISRNNGVYLTRTYQMHDDPNYAAMVLSADPVMQKRVAAALDEFRLSTRQGYINRLMATLPPGTASLTAARAAADRWMTTTGESIAKHALTDFLTTQQEISRGSGAAGTLNRGILTEKTDLPPALRELLGQTSDNITAAARSIHEIGRYNATHEFQTNIFTALDDAEKDRQSELARLRALGAAISPEDAEKLDKLDSVMYMTKNREEALRHKLMPFARASEKVQTQAYGPLQDVYGPSILVEAVHSLEPEELSGMMAALQTLTARSQMNLTVLSPKAQIRNVLANPGWYIAAGHYQIWRMKWKPRVMAALAAAGTDRKTADNRMREFYAQYGITGGSPLSAVMDTIAESGYSNIEDTLDRLYQSAAARAAAKVGNKIEVGLQKIEDYAKEKYEAGDDFFKIAIFEAELADYMKSFGVPDQSDGSIVVSDPVTADRIIAAFASNKRIPPVRLRELSGSRTELAREYLIREAAASTRDSIAYYDQLPPVIEGLKRNLGVAVAPFLSYRIAMPMAIIGSLKRAAADFQRPETRAKGLRRIAGTTFLFLGFNWAMSYAVKLAYALGSAAIGALFGDDEDKKKQLPNGVSASDSDRDKGLRDLLGEWYRNRSVSYLGTAPNGDIIYSDISWLNPTSSLRDVFVPLLANWSRTTRSWEDFGAAARETVSRVAEPFIAPQVTIADVVMAATADNFDAQTRTPLEKAGAAMQAFASAALVPGGINDLLRVYDARKTTKFWQELGSYSTGLRIKTLNVNDAVTNNLRTTKKKLEAAAADLRKLRYAEKPTDAQITEEYAKVMDRYRQSLQVSRDAVESARLFIPYDTIRSILRDGEHGISRKNTLGIERGLVPVYTLPDTVVAEMRKADVKNGTTRTDAYRRAVAAQQPLKLY